MEPVYIPQKEKHYTLEEWMIKGVISGKMLQWKERQELQIKSRSMKQSAMDILLDRPKWPSKTNYEAFLNMLSDENLYDLLLLVEMGETLDVNTGLDSGAERFLDFYKRHPELRKSDRYFMISEIIDRKYLPAAIRIGQLLMELPRGTDISSFPKNLFNWNDGETLESLHRIKAEQEDEKENESEEEPEDEPENIIPFPSLEEDISDE